MNDKMDVLKAELKKYEEQLVHMATEFAETKAGSNYGVEYYEIQCRVLQSMIEGIKKEMLELKKKKSGYNGNELRSTVAIAMVRQAEVAKMVTALV